LFTIGGKKSIVPGVHELLKAYRLSPLKKYGQSFLINEQVLQDIVAAGCLRQDDVVLEIGPGLGTMTRLLADRVARLTVIEIDERLIPLLQDIFAASKNVEIIHGDILTCDFSSFAPVQKIKVMGNIPYNITSEILFRLLAFRCRIDTAVLLMQQEVAERLTARPGTKAYGIPTVLLGMYARMEKLFTVASHCFHPVPAVQSAIVRLTFHDRPVCELNDEAFFRSLVRAAFAQRRKTLLNNLKAFSKISMPVEMVQHVLGEIGIDGSRRAETLTVAEFAKLSNALGAKEIREIT
jgi:16S rRNA (adenine1518-N6/adenine1519-N6)-dimethyltransferase